MIELEKVGDVYIIHMKAEENRFNGKFIAKLNQVLDEVENAPDPASLVTTGEGKFYSNGLDLDWMLGEGSSQTVEHITNVHNMLLRMLTFPLVTVAAINGHAFAAGAMLSLAHDYRVMRSDRGYFCLPEVDIKIPFSAPMDILIRSRLPKMVAHQAMCTATRFSGTDAVEKQIADLAVSEEDVLPKSIELAQKFAGKDRKTLKSIKCQIYSQVIDIFKKDVAKPLDEWLA